MNQAALKQPANLRGTGARTSTREGSRTVSGQPSLRGAELADHPSEQQGTAGARLDWSFGAIPLVSGRGVLRAKLEVSAPDDPLEREADLAADRVLRAPTTPPVIQRRAGDSSGAAVTSPVVPGIDDGALRSALTGGAALPDAERSFFESRFQHDFGAVRIHTGARAAEMARALNAHAFTLGADVAFADGRFRPGTGEGRRLLAHELAHVVQAGAGAPRVLLARGHDSRSTNKRSTGEAFFDGLVQGLTKNVGEKEIEGFVLRLAGASLLQPVFLAGTVVGIGRDVVGAIQGVIEIVGNFSKVVQELKELITKLLADPDVARSIGFETGQHYSKRFIELSREDILSFAYHWGELVGPTITYTVLAVLGLPQIAGAAIFLRLAQILRSYPRIARLLLKLARRFHPKVVIGGKKNALLHELAQATRFARAEGGGHFRFPEKLSQGIDGFFTPKGTTRKIPVSLKDFTGTNNIRNIIGRINVNSRMVEAAGHHGSAILHARVKATAREMAAFAKGGPLAKIPSEGVFQRLIFECSDGIVEVTTSRIIRR